MNRQELLKFHSAICLTARTLMCDKNYDYAGDPEQGAKPFANFERVEALGVCSTERGFLVRMTDKLSRLSSFAEAGKLVVKDESAEDTLIDLINYSILLAAYISTKKVDHGK